MDEPPTELSSLLERSRKGDEAAARELVEHLFPMVMKIIQGRLPRRESAEDLAQEVFLKMFSRLDQYRGTVPVSHWVSRIAVNHCLNALRAERKRPEWRWSDLSEDHQAVLRDLATADGDPHPSQALSARELVEKLLASLSADDALLLRLLELEDRSVDEISRMTGWSSTRIRVRAFRARRRLNRRFAHLREEDSA